VGLLLPFLSGRTLNLIVDAVMSINKNNLAEVFENLEDKVFVGGVLCTFFEGRF
jgi:hypothetical protein